MDKQQIGKEAEQNAEHYLKQQGLKPVFKNFFCRFGEIDLIMLDRNTLTFIEVRSRKNRHYGGAAASVTRAKQNRIIKAAQFFLAQHKKYQKHDCRFDIIAFENSHELQQPLWYKGAFTTAN